MFLAGVRQAQIIDQIRPRVAPGALGLGVKELHLPRRVMSQLGRRVPGGDEHGERAG